MTAGTRDSVEVVANVNIKRIKLYFNITLLLPVKMKKTNKKKKTKLKATFFHVL